MLSIILLPSKNKVSLHAAIHRLLWPLALGTIFLPQKILALTLVSGLSVIDEGDDRSRPGASIGVVIGDNVIGKMHIYGKQYAEIKEQTAILSLGHRFPIFANSWLKGAIGGALMNERIVISGGSPATENNINVGLFTGIAVVPKSNSKLYFECSWDSHVFLAGLAGLFLTTGRKQAITFAVGMSL